MNRLPNGNVEFEFMLPDGKMCKRQVTDEKYIDFARDLWVQLIDKNGYENVCGRDWVLDRQGKGWLCFSLCGECFCVSSLDVDLSRENVLNIIKRNYDSK